MTPVQKAILKGPKPRTLRAVAMKDAPRRPAVSHDSMAAVAQAVMQKYPALRQVNPFVVDSRGQSSQHGGGLEYYHANTEDSSPLPSLNTIEVFDPNLTGQWLEDAVAGEALHGLPFVDPRFASMRRAFQQSLTPAQVAFDQRKFKETAAPNDTFESFMDRSWLDAYIRGYLFPDKNDEWRQSGVYTPEQRDMLERMRSYITKK